MKKIVTLITILVFSVQLVAKEGMWIPMLLNNNIAEMQAMGCELSAEDIYSVNHSSLEALTCSQNDVARHPIAM